MMTILANMFINSDARFEHLKDSFESFSDSSDDWLINIRGEKRDEIIAYLKDRLGGKATFFDLLDDSRGWTTNALGMVGRAKHPYILLWNEDHMNIAVQGHLGKVVEEMQLQKAEYLQYSWWRKGRYNDQFEILQPLRGTTIDVVTIDCKAWKKLREARHDVHLVSLVGIFEKDFLIRLLQHDRFMLPAIFRKWLFRIMVVLEQLGLKFDQKEMFDRVNRFLFFKLRKQSKETPHDFEKTPDRYDVLPVRTALPHEELFVCMDDDDLVDQPYSLATRGLYPVRDLLIEWNPAETLQKYISSHAVLVRGALISGAYTYPDIHKHVRLTITREYLQVLRGKISITIKGQTLELEAGQGAGYFTNIKHEITALEDSEIERFTPDLGLAPRYILT